MRFLAISDLHDRNIFDALEEYLQKKKYGAVLLLGDITKSVLFAQRLFSLLLTCSNNIFFIPGNNEPERVIWFFEEKKALLHERRVGMNDINIVGFGYSPPTQFHTRGELEEEEIKRRMEPLRIDRNTMLITHAPPYGVLDRVANGEHIGSKAIGEMIALKKPMANVCGHVHEVEGVEKFCETEVIKVPAAIFFKAVEIDVDEGIRARVFSF